MHSVNFFDRLEHIRPSRIVGRVPTDIDSILDGGSSAKEPDPIVPTARFRRGRTTSTAIVALPIMGCVALAFGIRACQQAADKAGEYRGPAACEIIDQARVASLVPDLGHSRFDAAAGSIDVDLVSHNNSGDGASTTHDHDVLGSTCTTTEFWVDDSLAPTADSDTGTSINGVGSTSGSIVVIRVEVILARADRTLDAGAFQEKWAAAKDRYGLPTSDSNASIEHLGEPAQQYFQRARSDGRDDDCFAATDFAALPDTLLVAIDTTATGHCDQVIALLDAMVAMLGTPRVTATTATSG